MATDLERTEELFAFLQGVVPDGYQIPDTKVPQLNEEQAWTVIWYLGNLYWRVTDHVERCDVCGDLYDSESEGTCFDSGGPPYHFCDACENGPEAVTKQRQERAARKRKLKRLARARREFPKQKDGQDGIEYSECPACGAEEEFAPRLDDEDIAREAANTEVKD